MNNLQQFQDFLTTHSGDISVISLVFNLVITGILCALLGLFYLKYGTSLSNRQTLAKNFVVVGVTTALVITIVKASLALSLGLVGALSIVRFRAAIKEPEELAFLFVTIAIGLGMGADQVAVTVVAFVIIVLSFVAYRHYMTKKVPQTNFFLTVTTDEADCFTAIKNILENNCEQAFLKRYDKREGLEEIVYLIECQSVENFELLSQELDKLPGRPRYSFVEDIKIV